jgi:hypothetical protein
MDSMVKPIRLAERIRAARHRTDLDSVYDKRASTAEPRKVTVASLVDYSSM